MATFTSIVGGSVVNRRNMNNIGHVEQIILTQAEYDALTPPNDETLYFITEN